MRTTFDLNDDVFRRLKRRAADDNTTLRAVVEAALRAYLSDKKPGRMLQKKLRSAKGKLQPGIDLDDRAALHDIMDGLK